MEKMLELLRAALLAALIFAACTTALDYLSSNRVAGGGMHRELRYPIVRRVGPVRSVIYGPPQRRTWINRIADVSIRRRNRLATGSLAFAGLCVAATWGLALMLPVAATASGHTWHGRRTIRL